MPQMNSPSATQLDDVSGNSGKPRRTWVSICTLFLIACAAVFLRFLFLVRKPFWFDECFSVEVARLTWHDFIRLMWRREANMSLYYLLLRGWLHFGSSPFFIRSLSVLLSLAALPAIYWLAAKLFDRRVALIAVALMSFNAYPIRYAQEARSYSLFVLLAILSSGFFVAAARNPSRRNSVGYILSSVLAVYSHLYALLLIGAHWLSVRRVQGTVGSARFRRAWIWIGIASLPMVIFAAKTGAGPIRWIHRPGFRDILEFAERFTGNDGILLLLLYAMACFTAVVAQEKLLKRLRTEINGDAWALRFLLVWLIFPVILVVVLSLARPLFLGRYFIFCLPALVILAAAGLAKLTPRWLLGASLAAILLLSLQGTFSYYDHDFDLERDDSQAATNYILDHAQPGDAILFHIAEARVPYEFFKSLRGKSIADDAASGPQIVYPRHGERLDYRDFTGKPSNELVRSLTATYPRLWVVLMSNGAPAHPDATTLMLDQQLGNAFPRVDGKLFFQVEVRLYQRQ
jgi:mannosyltransferase